MTGAVIVSRWVFGPLTAKLLFCDYTKFLGLLLYLCNLVRTGSTFSSVVDWRTTLRPPSVMSEALTASSMSKMMRSFINM